MLLSFNTPSCSKTFNLEYAFECGGNYHLFYHPKHVKHKSLASSPKHNAKVVVKVKAFAKVIIHHLTQKIKCTAICDKVIWNRI